jgi:quinol monooxygenase YgiN
MSEPFVYVGTWTIKDGKLEEARKSMAALVDFVETNEPRLIAFHVYFDETGKTCSVVQVHPDCASMEFHMKVNAEHFATGLDIIEEIKSEQYYGKISDKLGAELAKWDDMSVAVTKMPVFEAGFTRTNVR